MAAFNLNLKRIPPIKLSSVSLRLLLCLNLEGNPLRDRDRDNIRLRIHLEGTCLLWLGLCESVTPELGSEKESRMRRREEGDDEGWIRDTLLDWVELSILNLIRILLNG